MPQKESGFCSNFFCQTRWGGGAAAESTTNFVGGWLMDRSEHRIIDKQHSSHHRTHLIVFIRLKKN